MRVSQLKSHEQKALDSLRQSLHLEPVRQTQGEEIARAHVDLVVIEAFPQVLKERVFRKGFQEDHVAHPDHVVQK